MDASISAENTDFSAAFATSTRVESSDTALVTAATPTIPVATATIATTFTSTRDDGQLETIQSTVYQTADPTASPAANTESATPDGNSLSSGAVVALAICVTLAVVAGLLLTWYFVRRHRKRKEREATEAEGQIAEKDSSERSELCGAPKPHEAPDNVAHEMYVPPHEILGAPIEGPTQPLKLSPDVEYSHSSTDSRAEDVYEESTLGAKRARGGRLPALPWLKKGLKVRPAWM